jgi:hypothetical protein
VTANATERAWVTWNDTRKCPPGRGWAGDAIGDPITGFVLLPGEAVAPAAQTLATSVANNSMRLIIHCLV